MDFYEELGISRHASEEEIRRAYRNLAKLLHPDQQPDDVLRKLAGIQMVRLNQMLHTLTEPVLRAQYDDSLRVRPGRAPFPAGVAYPARQGPRPPFDFSVSRRPSWKILAWLGAGTLAVIAIALLLGGERSGERVESAVDSGALVVPRSDVLAGAVPIPARSRFSAEKPSEPHGPAPGFRASSERNFATMPPPSTARAGSDTGLPLNSRPAGLVGEWFYPLPANAVEAAGMCEPLYIDLEISEVEGTLRGRYSAKYKIGARPISPFVAFEFSGAEATQTDFTWNGSGGSTGRLRLNLVSARSLEVNWNASQVGDELGFSSGTALLLRRQ